MIAGPARRAVAGRVGVVGADAVAVGPADLVPGRVGADAEDAGAGLDRASRAQERGERGGQAGRVVGPAQLAGRVHRQLGHADVDGGDAEPGGGEGPDGGAARLVVAADEHLVGHAGPSQASTRTAWVPASVA